MAEPTVFDPFAAASAAANQPAVVDPFAPAYKPPKAALARGVNAAVRGTTAAAAGTAALVAGAAGDTAGRDAALEASRAQSALAGEDAMRVEDVTDLGSGLDFFQYALGYLGTQATTSLAGGAAGRLIGGLGGRALGVAGANMAAKHAGTVAGLAGTSLMQEVGSIFPEAMEQGVNDPINRALVGGTVAAAADLIPEAYVAKRFGAFGKAARGGPGVAATAAKVGAGEAATELFQTYVERAAAGQPTTGAEANSDYVNSVVLGALGGSIAGGVTGAYDRTRKTVDPTEEAPVLDPLAPTPESEPTPLAPAPEPTAFQNFDATGPGNEPTTTGELQLDENVRPVDLTVPDNASLPFKTRTPEGILLGDQPAPPAPGELILPRTEGFQRSATDLIRDNRIARAVGTFEVAPTYSKSRTTTANDRLTSALPPDAPVSTEPVQIEGAPQATAMPADLFASVAVPEGFTPPPAAQAAPAAPKATKPAPLTAPKVTRSKDFRDTGNYEVALPDGRAALIFRDPESKQWYAENPPGQTTHFTDRFLGFNREEALAALPKKLDQLGATAPGTQAELKLESKASVEPLLASAAEYNTRNGLAPAVQVPYAEVDPVAMTRIAEAYDAAPVSSPEAEAAYTAFKGEVEQQFDQLAKTIRIEPWSRPGQPYANSAEMRADVTERGHLYVYEGGDPHPSLTPEQNYMFRAIHDIYGHAMTGFQFGPRGELNATRAHARMFSNHAIPALVTETIGQNAWVNFGAANAGKPVQERAYATQKAVLLPEGLWRGLLQDSLDSRAAVQERVDQLARTRGEAAIAQIEHILGTPPNLAVTTYLSEQGAGAIRLGQLKDVIEINLGAKDALSVANHESFHYLEFRVLPKRDREIIARAITKGQPVYEKLLARVAEYDRVNGTQLLAEVRSVPAEARAYAFEFWSRGELAATGALERVFKTLRAVMERISNAIAGLGFTSHEDVFRAIEAGYYARRSPSPLNITPAEDPYLGDIEADAIPGTVLARDKASSTARGRPFWVNNPQDVKNLRTRLRLLALEGARARDWHARSGSAVLQWARGDVNRARTLAALISNYSPRTPVGRDLVKALTHLDQWETNRPIKVGAPESHIKTATDILTGKSPRDENDNVAPTGIKRQNFFRNLMLGIDPVRYNAEAQGATIDMWMSHAFNYGDVAGSVTKSQYNYADAEVKRLARELGWGVEETQAAIWVAIKGRGDSVRTAIEKYAAKAGWYEYQTKEVDIAKTLREPELFGALSVKKYVRSVKPEAEKAFVTQWMNFALQTPFNEESFQRANYSYAEAFADVAAGRLRPDLDESLPFAVNEDAAQDHAAGPQTMSLFSRAAVSELAMRAHAGEVPQTQLNARIAELLDSKDATGDVRQQYLDRAGAEASAAVGGLKRAYLSNISSGENLARQSLGYKNVFGALTAFGQRKNRLIADAVEKKLSKWVKGAAAQDKVVVSQALLDRTVNGWTTDSGDYARMYAGLSPAQREMFDQATEMIADRLEGEFRADTASYARALGPGTPQYREWYESRRAQVDQLKKNGYFPERRYGDHVVHAYVEGANGKRITLYYSQHQREADARLEERDVKSALGNEPEIKVEYGYRYKADYDGSLSFQQFLDMANRNGITLEQAERERIAKALVAADSVRRNRIFRRKNIAGYSEDGMRILAEFGVAMANKIAYYEIGGAVNDAIAGREVSIKFDRQGEVTVETLDGQNLWDRDGPLGGYYRNLADKTADFVLSPTGGSKWSSGLRAAATVQFLGGSIAAGLVQMTSMAMNTTPWLNQYTGYTDALTRSLSAYKLAMQNHKALVDLPTVLNDNIAIPGIDEVPGLRHALQIAAQDGTTLDTEIYQIMGLSRGQELSFSGRTQTAIRAWMTPFRLTEQWNRMGTFIAAFKLAKDQKKTDDEAYKFAQQTVYSTQFRYDEANRPALARSDWGSLLMVFKSYPIFMLETFAHLSKESPKAAATMLLTLTLMAGVEGLPFAEDLEDVIDTVSQRVFGSAFNTKRALRNTIKAASEAIVGADLSGVVMHGLANELTGMSFASRVGMGNLIPGTRLGAAEADYKRTAGEILGPVGTLVTGVFGGADALSRGEFTEAAKQALPLAGQNLVKGVEQWTRGYASDIGGRKLIDVDGWHAFWQSVGFSSSALMSAYESDRIDRQTVAFYKQAHDSFVKDITKALRDGDSAAVADAVSTVTAWNQSHPDMPMAISPDSIRKHIQLAGLPMNQRTFLLMPKGLRGTSEYALEMADR